MKTKVILISIVIFFFSVPTFCQIAIKEIEKHVEAEVQKPPTYDSLHDYRYSTDILHNYQYVGLKVFLPPCPKGQESSENKKKPNTRGIYRNFYSLRAGSVEFHTDCNSLGSKYFTVLDALNRDSLINIKNRMNSLLRNGEFIQEFTQTDDLGFVLKDDIAGDTLYFMGTLDDFVFVPFFVKQKEMFDGKTFIAALIHSPRNEYPAFKDIITDKEVKIKQGSKWKCEVALLENSKVHNNFTGSRDWSIYYILKNGNQTIAIGRSRFYYGTKTNPEKRFSSSYKYFSFIK